MRRKLGNREVEYKSAIQDIYEGSQKTANETVYHKCCTSLSIEPTSFCNSDGKIAKWITETSLCTKMFADDIAFMESAGKR